MYKIGDKVEYLNSVWEVCDCEIDSVEIYNDKLGINIYVPISDVQPYRTAHEKLIEMGWEYKGYGALRHIYEIKHEYNFTENIVIFPNSKSYLASTNRKGHSVVISLTIARILTQYLEELK